jgi:glutathione synthase
MSAPTDTLALPLDRLASHASSYASANGLQVARKNDPSSYECAPISLLPNAYPRKAFQRAQTLAAPFNLLVDRISRDGPFLEQTLEEVVEADPYTGKLLDLYKEIYMNEPGFAHSADRLGIHRSDYMLNAMGKTNQYELKQVELNTIASSFAGLAVNVASLHRHLVSRFQPQVKDFLGTNKQVVMGSDELEEKDGVPENPALTSLPQAFSVAYNRYKERFGGDPVVLFVVQDGETNTVDQRMLEFALWDNHKIPVVRTSLTKAVLDVDMDTGALSIQLEDGSQKEVALVYFRAGYAPTDYPDGYDGLEWKARKVMELSRATKSPCLGYHLAGTKKVQQELARPGTLERFFPQQEEQPLVELLRSAFAGLFSLGSDATDEDLEAVKECLSGMEGQYVLKPQREGGGYNYYGDRLVNKLRENVKEPSSGVKLGKELAEFILMERLFPPNQRAILLRSGKVEGTGDSISELGCFGAVVASDSGEIVHNEYAGFLLRTKFSNVDEGGVASGFATLSSPFLC